MVARSDVLMEDKKVKPPRSSVPAAKELQVGVMQLKHKRVTTSHNVPTMFVDAWEGQTVHTKYIQRTPGDFCAHVQISLHALNRKKNGKVTRQDFVWGLSDSNIVLDKIGFEAVWKFLGGGIAPDAQIDIKLIVRQLSIWINFEIEF